MEAQCLRVLSTACFFPSALPRPGRRGCLNCRRGLSSLDFYVLLEFNNEDPRLTLHYTGRGRSDAALGIRVQPSRGVRPKTASVALGPLPPPTEGPSLCSAKKLLGSACYLTCRLLEGFSRLARQLRVQARLL